MNTSVRHYTQTEGGDRSVKPSLIARSPYKYHGDIERDMERNHVKKAPQSAEPSFSPVRPTKSLNPRGPHYSGTHSQHGSSTSSSRTSLSNSSSGYSYLSDQLHQDPQYGHQIPRRPGDHGYYQQSYLDTRHSEFSRQHHPTSQYLPNRSSYNNYAPMGYYQSHEQQQQQKHEYDYQTSEYRHSSRQRGALVKAYSEETFREVGQHDNERGFSSLGDVPNRVPRHRQDLPLRQPLTQYKYQMEYPRQYREPSPSSTQYSCSSGSNYSSDMNGTEMQIERMRVDSDSNIEILKQPLDQVVNLNERAVFICEAHVIHCEEEPNILWFKNREPLIGEIDSTYVIDETTEKDAGVYHCLVTHPLNTSVQKESYSATLTVNKEAPTNTPPLASLPEVIEQPLGTVKAVVGDPLVLVIRVKGEEPLSYQWYRNSQPMNFAQSSVLRFPVAAITDGGMYCCRVANNHGSILSKSFTLEVTKVKALSTDLSDSYLSRVGSIIAQQVRSVDELAVSFGVRVSQRTAYRSLEEQLVHLLKIWRDNKNGSKQKLASILQQHRLVLHDSTRNLQYVQPKKVTAKLHVLRQPQSSKVIYGQPVSLQVTVSTVSPSIKYQWYLNGKALVGQTLSCLSISSVVDSDVGEYVCVISSNEARVQSEHAVVELTDALHQRVSLASQGSVLETPKRYLIERGVPSNRGADPGFEPRLSSFAQSSLKEAPLTIVIEEHPASVEVEPGDPLTLRCRATSSHGDLKYSWYFNGLLIEEEQSDYVLNCFTDEDEGFYICKVSNGFSSVTSNTAQVKTKLDSD